MEDGDLVGRLRDLGIRSADLAADALEAAQAENAKLRAAIERQAAAVRTLHHNEQTEINVLRSKQTEAHRAVATLDSEREMNALLTEENEAAQARIAALEAELAGARVAALEEAAKVAEGQRTDDGSLWDCAAESIAAAIRALKAAQP